MLLFTSKFSLQRHFQGYYHVWFYARGFLFFNLFCFDFYFKRLHVKHRNILCFSGVWPPLPPGPVSVPAASMLPVSLPWRSLRLLSLFFVGALFKLILDYQTWHLLRDVKDSVTVNIRLARSKVAAFAVQSKNVTQNILALKIFFSRDWSDRSSWSPRRETSASGTRSPVSRRFAFTITMRTIYSACKLQGLAATVANKDVVIKFLENVIGGSQKQCRRVNCFVWWGILKHVNTIWAMLTRLEMWFSPEEDTNVKFSLHESWT